MNWQNESVLITGGSRGLGAALAEKLVKNGANVAIVSRSEEDLLQAKARFGNSAALHTIAGDVGKKEDAHRIAGIAAALIGPISLLVHNASTLGPLPMRLLLDTECEDFAQVLDTNLTGPFRLTKIVAGSMALRGKGTVVHISSDAAVAAYPHWGAYGVSKIALDHLSRTFAVELQDTGVRFLSIDPGEMDTAMHADALPDADKTLLANPHNVAAQIASLLERGEYKSGSRVVASEVFQ